MKSKQTTAIVRLLILALLPAMAACTKDRNPDSAYSYPDPPIGQPALPPAAPPNPSWPLVWADEFNRPELDTTEWFHRAPGPRRDGFNDPTAVRIDSSGLLEIRCFTDTVNGRRRMVSGMIATRKEFLYGRFECRIAFSNISGTWSGFWLQSPTKGNPLGNPAVAGAEIDVVEGMPIRCETYHTVHWDGYTAPNARTAQYRTPFCSMVPDSFYVFAVEWTPQEYRFFRDGKLLWRTSQGLSKRSEFMILSSEIWNNATWCGLIPAAGYGARENSRNRLLVDYVRVYRMP